MRLLLARLVVSAESIGVKDDREGNAIVGIMWAVALSVPLWLLIYLAYVWVAK